MRMPNAELEAVQHEFLTFVSGSRSPYWLLVHELECEWLQCHWAGCVLRFWNELRAKPTCMAAHAARADLSSMLKGVDGMRRMSWTFQVCQFLCKLGMLEPEYTAPILRPHTTNPHGTLNAVYPSGAYDYFRLMVIDVNEALRRLRALWRSRVLRIYGHELNPRATTSPHVRYLCWVGLPEADGSGGVRPHLRFTHALHQQRCFMRLRLGKWGHLAVHKRRDLPLCERKCQRCRMGAIEDEYHVLFDCRFYRNVRCRHLGVFDASLLGMNQNDRMRTFLGQQSSEVVYFVHELYTWSLPEFEADEG
jgi:hypothetical protein